MTDDRYAEAARRIWSLRPVECKAAIACALRDAEREGMRQAAEICDAVADREDALAIAAGSDDLTPVYRRGERAAQECSRLIVSEAEARNEAGRPSRPDVKAMTEALQASVTAIDDWLHQYASEMCGEDRVRETAERIRAAGGTLAYIAEVQERNRSALSGKRVEP